MNDRESADVQSSLCTGIGLLDETCADFRYGKQLDPQKHAKLDDPVDESVLISSAWGTAITLLYFFRCCSHLIRHPELESMYKSVSVALESPFVVYLQLDSSLLCE